MEITKNPEPDTWTLEEVATPPMTSPGLQVGFESHANGIEEDSRTSKIKSSQRLQYEAQMQVIRNQIGDLEKVRTTLGLTRRKLAQLLLVDPSAWTRWLKEGSAPPHVYRSLQWFMMLQEKVPGLTANYFLGPNTEFSPMALRQHVRDQIRTQLQSQLSTKNMSSQDDGEMEYRAEMVVKIQRLESELERNRKMTVVSVVISVLLAATVIFLFFKHSSI